MLSSRRFFRSALLSTGALLAGTALVLPGVAQADAPSFPAKFDFTTTTAVTTNPSLGQLRVIGGLPDGGRTGVVRVDASMDLGMLRFTDFIAGADAVLREGGIAVYGGVEQVQYTGAGHMNAADQAGTAVAAVVSKIGGGHLLAIYGADGADGIAALDLPDQPTGLAVGRFLPDATADGVAVSLASGETRIYGFEGPELEEQAIWADLAGPLSSWKQGAGAQLALGATRNGGAVSALGVDGTTATVTSPVGIPDLAEMQSTGSQDLDLLGRRWGGTGNSDGTTRAFGFSVLGGPSDAFTGSNSKAKRAVVARFGRVGAGRDTVGLIGESGADFRAPDGTESSFSLGGQDAALVDADRDGRDDIVVPLLTGGPAELVVYRNITGSQETATTLAAAQFVQPLTENAAGDLSTTETTLDWKVPSDGAAYRCAVDGAQLGTCAGTFTLAQLGTGAHTLRVQRREQGLTFFSAVSEFEFVVQPKPPVFATTPPAAVQNAAARITDRPGSTLQCRVYDPRPFLPDTGDFATCAADWTRELAEGEYRAEFRWVDGNDVASEALSYDFTVDRTEPGQPGIMTVPDEQTSSRTAVITFMTYGDAVATQCSLDDGPYETCVDEFRRTGLTQGPHRVRVRQVDAAGNVGEPDVVDWEITAPEAPRFTFGPSGFTTDTTASFGFQDQTEGQIECALDGAAFRACGPTVELSGLTAGDHVLHARTSIGADVSEVTDYPWTVAAIPDGDTSEPTGPQFGDAPVNPLAPAPTPTPAPTPAPAPTPMPELKAPTAPLAGKTAAVVGRTLTVGCTVPGAASYRCEVSVTKGGKTLGRAVRTGNGSVQIKLTRAGARQVQRSGKGLTVRVQVKATVDGKSTVTTKTVRLLPTKDLALSADEFFGAKGAKPTAAAKRIAKDIAAQLSGARRITITGHTDNAGSPAVNERLGLERAQAISALLRGAGLGGAKVVVESAGETSPTASNGTAKGRKANRRVEIAVRY
ncbi:OmpA family protein [Patulibacter americanus]|uniref:OmpA family protein n=1 Tax=Patulibacter americanus TaxID=588672 RepID=UPI0003B30F7B|nr:OmpA family protein [Patulibacter americanus]